MVIVGCQVSFVKWILLQLQYDIRVAIFSMTFVIYTLILGVHILALARPMVT